MSTALTPAPVPATATRVPVRPTRRRRSTRRTVAGVLVWAALAVLLVWVLAPMAVMVATSFKPSGEIFQIPPRLLPEQPTWQNYVKVFTESTMGHSFLNSALVALLVTVITLILGISTGYALVRIRFRGANLLSVYMLVGQLLPITIFLLPLYQIVSTLGLMDSIAGIALAHLTIVLPLVVWMIRNTFLGVPVELEEAARIDGCTRTEAVVAVILPVAAPGLAAVGIFAFLQSWNEFVLASVLTTTTASRTAPVALTEFAGQFDVDWGSTMAAATIMTVPIAILFLCFQRYFVSGMAAGAVKG